MRALLRAVRSTGNISGCGFPSMAGVNRTMSTANAGSHMVGAKPAPPNKRSRIASADF